MHTSEFPRSLTRKPLLAENAKSGTYVSKSWGAVAEISESTDVRIPISQIQEAWGDIRGFSSNMWQVSAISLTALALLVNILVSSMTSDHALDSGVFWIVELLALSFVLLSIYTIQWLRNSIDTRVEFIMEAEGVLERISGGSTIPSFEGVLGNEGGVLRGLLWLFYCIALFLTAHILIPVVQQIPVPVLDDLLSIIGLAAVFATYLYLAWRTRKISQHLIASMVSRLRVLMPLATVTAAAVGVLIVLLETATTPITSSVWMFVVLSAYATLLALIIAYQRARKLGRAKLVRAPIHTIGYTLFLVAITSIGIGLLAFSPLNPALFMLVWFSIFITTGYFIAIRYYSSLDRGKLLRRLDVRTKAISRAFSIPLLVTLTITGYALFILLYNSDLTLFRFLGFMFFALFAIVSVLVLLIQYRRLREREEETLERIADSLESTDTTLVPTSSMSFEKQIRVLKAYIVLSNRGIEPLHYKQVLRFTRLARTQISGVNAFFVSLGFLKRVERGTYIPTDAFLQSQPFAHGRVQLESLQPIVRDSPLYSFVRGVLMIHGEVQVDGLVALLLEESGESTKSRAKRALEWLERTKLITVDEKGNVGLL